MELEWDAVKRRANYAKHGLDFRDAAKVFQGITLTAEDDRQDYGEQRFISMGLLEDMVVVVGHTARSEKTRIISMRKANQRERQTYEEKIFFGREAPPEYEG
jgi:uncharacterized DUF497 family protein